jgi:hypothetical protein
MNAETIAALALAEAGVPKAGLDRALRTIDVADTDTAETIAAKIDDLRTDLPGLFAGAVGRRAAAPRKGSLEDRGREALERAGLTARERAVERWETKSGQSGGSAA